MPSKALSCKPVQFANDSIVPSQVKLKSNRTGTRKRETYFFLLFKINVQELRSGRVLRQTTQF